MKPGREEGTYNNPLMDCSSMSEYLDVLSAHDQLRDRKRLKTVYFQTGDDHRPLDLGFPASDDDQITNTHKHPQLDMLDMQFPTLSNAEQSNYNMLDLGFPLELDVGDVLDLGFTIEVSDPAGNTDGALEMGFDTNDISPDESPLEMGFDVDPTHDSPLEMSFDMDPLHFDLDRSFIVIQPDPIGFVIQRAVGDLYIAMY
ncbi:hypothetical protein CY34DRAFT_14073 [Suillus luteus UH-Slu-Lm8-n1]|uniref:Uncharacterized protein n=1 Tax=Suillus luteus UH-Slu-Lm8-n1 TaxID=930992 RepID=A0A0D0APK4_9AGAM|nr:hypothetical protein CY34DRAFT_14073 [Suillus luteus UH-Slu-Lm8-n1]